MSIKLEDFVKKIILIKDEKPNIRLSILLDENYEDIISVIKYNNLKLVVESLNKNGFLVSYDTMRKALNRLEKNRTKKQNPQNNILPQGKIIESNQQKQVTINQGKNDDVKKDDVLNNDEDYYPPKHLTLKQQAEKRIAEMGLDFDENPLLTKRRAALKQREKEQLEKEKKEKNERGNN
jgi:hypothetical protein